ncbi:MAG: hypothetical protein ACRETL_00550, partial [Gammaproteobacteria bacterium]
MSGSRQVAAIVAAMAALALASPALAQTGAFGPGIGGGQSPLSLQSLESSGNRKQGEKDADVIKDAKREIDDADPRVRVQGLEKLRYVQSTDANDLLYRGLVDS